MSSSGDSDEKSRRERRLEKIEKLIEQHNKSMEKSTGENLKKNT
jgi:hypothetical protein